jgi:ABC-2 type transport system permease protein
MNLRRAKAVARKEILHIVRDVRSLIMALALPVVMLVLFGYALTLDVDRIPMAVFDSSNSPESRELISHFEGSRYFDIRYKVDNYNEVETALEKSKVLGGLIIPPDYSKKLKGGSKAEVQLLLDGSDSNTASIALGYSETIVQIYNLRLLEISGSVPPSERVRVENQVRVWYNPQLKSKNFIVPGLVAVILMIIAALLTSLTLAREHETGTMEQLLSTPVRASELVLGKMSAYFLLGVLDTVIAVVLGVIVFEVPIKGSLLLLALSCGIFLIGALSWGILLSATAKSQTLAYQLGMITSFLPAFLLSGFVFAIDNMPKAIQIITYIIPARYLITILRGIFLKGVGLEIIGVELLFLAAFAVFVFLFATKKLKRRVA